MRSYLLPLAAAATLALAGVAQAQNRDVTDYLNRVSAAATAEVAAAGVAPTGLTIKARVDSEGRLIGAHVAHSSGSLETDEKAAQAVRRLRVPGPPIVLMGAEVTVAVGEQPMVQAKTP